MPSSWIRARISEVANLDIQMPYKVRNENPVGDLVELKSRVSQDAEAGVHSDLEVELRVHPYEFEDSLGTISICFTQATLALELVGLEVVPNTKFGQPLVGQTMREIERETTSGTTTDTSKEAKGAVGTKASALDAGGNLELSGATSSKQANSQTVKETEKVQTKHMPVRAVGGNKWTIASSDGSLDGVYLDYHRLCSLTPVWGGNRQAVTAELLVKQKHMRSTLEKREGVVNAIFQTVNQKRIAGILVAKSIHTETTSAPYSGVLCLARSEASDEE